MQTETQTITNGFTRGISPKAILAAVLPASAGLIVVVTTWVATGEFDRSELSLTVGSILSAALGALGASLGSTGTVSGPVEADPLA